MHSDCICGNRVVCHALSWRGARAFFWVYLQVEHPCTFVVQFNGDAFRKQIADSVGTKTVSQRTAVP